MRVPDGRIEIRYDERALPYRVFDNLRQVNQAAIVDNKHLFAALAMDWPAGTPLL